MDKFKKEPLSFNKNFPPLLFGITLLVLVIKCLRNLKKWSECNQDVYAAYRSLPGPVHIPILRIPFDALLDKDILSLNCKWSKKYGGCFKVNFFNHECVVLNSPAYIQALLTSTDFGHLDKSDLQHILLPKEVKGLISSSGKDWRIRRKMLNPTFAYKSLQKYHQSFIRHSETLIQKLQNLYKEENAHPASHLINLCILHQTCETVMGCDISEFEDSAMLFELIDTVLPLIFIRPKKPWLLIPSVFNFFHGKEYKEALTKAHQFVQKIIDKTIDEMKTKDTSKTLGEDNIVNSKSLIETMIENGVGHQDILTEVGGQLAVALDGTSIVTEMTLFFLALYPEHQRRCQEEIDNLFQDPTKVKDGRLEFHALSDLKYVERCILETQRVHSLSSVMRKLHTPLKLDDDLVIPAGVSVSFMGHTIHHNPDIYPDPLRYDPERFSPEEVRKRHPYAYVPFSGGTRICIGMKLAIMEIKIMLAMILRNFDVHTTETRESLKIVMLGSPRPEKPINFIFKWRNNISNMEK